MMFFDGIGSERGKGDARMKAAELAAFREVPPTGSMREYGEDIYRCLVSDGNGSEGEAGKGVGGCGGIEKSHPTENGKFRLKDLMERLSASGHGGNQLKNP